MPFSLFQIKYKLDPFVAVWVWMGPSICLFVVSVAGTIHVENLPASLFPQKYSIFFEEILKCDKEGVYKWDHTPPAHIWPRKCKLGAKTTQLFPFSNVNFVHILVFL